MNVSGQLNAANAAPLNQPLPGDTGTYPGNASVAQPHMREHPYESDGTNDFIGDHGAMDPSARPGETTVASILGQESAPGTRPEIERPIHASSGTGAATATGTKPSMGQKVLGSVETMVGKATKNEHMIAEGQAKKMGAGSGGA